MKKKELTAEEQAMNDWYKRNIKFVIGLLSFLIISLATIIYWIIS